MSRIVEEPENNTALNPMAGISSATCWTQMKKPTISDRLKLKIGSGERNRTFGLQVMSLTSYHCSTPQCFVFYKYNIKEQKVKRIP